MKKKFQRDFSSLEQMCSFIQSFVHRNGLNEEIRFAIELVVEELFTNMLKYCPGCMGDIEIGLSKRKNEIVLTVKDFNSQPFDPTQAADYDATVPLSKRPTGKLGIHLIKKYMDDINCEYKNNMNKLTLTKILRKTHVRN
ncbi:MAG: ATP-binding protein [Calditrichia bacterium]